MKFYELTKENIQLKEMLEKEELTQQDFEENNEMLLELVKEKAVDLILVNNSFESDVESIDNYIKLLQEKKKSIQTKQENFNSYIMYNMQQLGLDKIETSLGKIQIKDSTKTDVNEDLLGKECFDIIYKRKKQKELKDLGYERAFIKTVTKKLYVK